MPSIEAARKQLLLPITAQHVVEDRASDDELELYRLDPFAHLDATEAWTDHRGDDWEGHIFVPLIETGDVGALRPMEHQVDFIENWVDLDRLQRGELRFFNTLVEKSRQMGMTWILAYLVWWILSYHDVGGGYTNMNASEVDDGGEASTTDSFFGKVRFIHDHVPPRHRAQLKFRGGNAPLIRRTGSSAFIVGRGAVMNPGRGGTYRYWLVDEAARFPHGEAAHAALDRAVPHGRVYNSTPYGEGNVYFRLLDERPRNWRFVNYHWTGHPLYGHGKHVSAVGPDPERGIEGHMSEQPDVDAQNAADRCELCKGTLAGIPWKASDPLSHRYQGKMVSPWYDDAVVGLTDDQVASELDIDYAGSLPARVYTEFDERVHVVDQLHYNDRLPIELAFDYGLDITAVAIIQDTPGEILQIGEVETTDAAPDEVSRAIVHTLASIGVPKGVLHPHVLATMFCVGDPAGDYREVGTGKSIAQQYADNHFIITSPAKPWSVAKTILTTKRILQGRPKRYLVSSSTCPKTIKHWRQNRWPLDRFGVRKPGATQPLDDEHNHMMRALAYYLTYKYPAPELEDELDAATIAARSRRDGVFTEARYGMKF